MSKHIQLSIADPCHENWDNMTAAEKGRFCGSCQKQVIDFTNMSDSQLAAFFKKPSTGSVCGRFYEDQLDRSIEIPKKRIPWVKYFFQFVLPAFLLSAKAVGQAKPKARTVAKTTEDAPKNCDALVGMLSLKAVERVQLTGDTTVFLPIQNSKNTVALSPAKLKSVSQMAIPVMIYGIVLDENDNPVPFASVMIKGTKMGTMANKAGVFKIEKSLCEKGRALQISSAGYEEREIPMNDEVDLTKDLVARLNIKVSCDEVVVISHPILGVIRRTTVSGYTTTVIGKTIDTLKEETSDTKQKLPTSPNVNHSLADVNSPKIYPNPVQRSQVLNVEWENEQAETIRVMLVSLNGNVVYSLAKQFDKGLNRLAIDVDSRWAAGIYIVQVRNEKNALIKNEKLIVQ
jgi:hypothetical protein